MVQKYINKSLYIVQTSNMTSFFIARGNQAVEVVAGGCVFILDTRF